MAGLNTLPAVLGIQEKPIRSILALHDTIREHDSTKELQALLNELQELQKALESLPEAIGTDEVTKAAMKDMGLANSIDRCGEYCESFNEKLRGWLKRPPPLKQAALHSHSMEIKRTEGEVAITKIVALFSREVAECVKELRGGVSPQQKTTLVQEKRAKIQSMADDIETHFVGSETDYPDFTSEQRQALSQRAQMMIEALAGQGS